MRNHHALILLVALACLILDKSKIPPVVQMINLDKYKRAETHNCLLTYAHNNVRLSISLCSEERVSKSRRPYGQVNE